MGVLVVVGSCVVVEACACIAVCGIFHLNSFSRQMRCAPNFPRLDDPLSYDVRFVCFVSCFMHPVLQLTAFLW